MGIVRKPPRTSQPAAKARDESGRGSDAPPLWQKLRGLGARVPKRDWDKLPRDLSRNVDHYLYGSPKR